jgi:CIC family chloride channel protein
MARDSRASEERRWTEEQRLVLDSVVLGVVGAGAAGLFGWLLRVSQHVLLEGLGGYAPPRAPGEPASWTWGAARGHLWIPVVTTLGGLLSGLIVYSFAPEAEGHGTDTAVKAFHAAGGKIRARVAPLKMIASAITIGSGGAAGREGPTALIASGFGSLYGRIFRRSAGERRLLLLIGMAAGLSAVFRSPIGTAIFAIEVLYGEMDFEGGALAYTMLSAVVAYSLNGIFAGWAPLFRVPASLPSPGLVGNLWYVVLGLLTGILGALIPTVFYGVRDLFDRLRIPRRLKPALGGLGVGLIALALPQVLGGGYGWIQRAIDGQLALSILAALVLAKLAAFSLTVSSGGSGGVFAPTLFVGAMAGGFLASALGRPPGPFVIVGMAATFGGAARVPAATLLMVTEMTGGYRLLVPAALAVIVAYLVQASLTRGRRYPSLYEAQVADRSASPAHNEHYLAVALRLLDERKLRVSESLGRLDLPSVLSSGVPVDLSDGTQVLMGALSPKSELVGKPVGEAFPRDRHAEAELIAIYRRGEALLPESGLVLKPRDRLLFIATESGRRMLAEHLTVPEEPPKIASRRG